MGELVKKEQVVSIVPQDFKNATKGKVIDVTDKHFLLEVIHQPKGIPLNDSAEFYSQTHNGVLYFESDVKKIEGNVITIDNPIKHRYLQRRKFTRIKFVQTVELKKEQKSHHASALDLSAGGMRLKTDECIDIDCDYNVSFELSADQIINCKFQPIRIEKRDDGFYTLSGRFQYLSNVDKMILVQFCMQKNMENKNK